MLPGYNQSQVRSPSISLICLSNDINYFTFPLGSEFFSVSTDGQALWWDIRKLTEPTETMTIDPEKNGVVVGGTVLDFEATMVPNFPG